MRSKRRLLILLTTFLWLLCPVTPADAGGNPFGINYDDQNSPPPAFARMPEAGLRWVRLIANWRSMEPVQGQIDFLTLDARVAEARAQGLNVFLSFYFMPSWANGSSPACIPFIDHNCSDPPTDPAFFRDFVTAVAQRYLGQVHYYGPWNEPNLTTFWGGSTQQFIDDILINASVALKAVDPGIIVVGPDTVFSVATFAAIISQACPHLDVLSAHFYPGHFSGSANVMFTDLDNQYLPQIQALCDKPLWITEFGIDSDITGQTVQAEEYTSALLGTLARDHVGAIFIYRLTDNGPPGSGIQMGILTDDHELKEAFYAIRDLTVSIDEPRLVQVDASAGNFLVLTSGSGAAGYTPAGTVVTGIPWGFPGPSPTDNLWNAENDTINGGLPGLNAWSSHPPFEDAPEVSLHVAQLHNGACYDVYVRYATVPSAVEQRGIVAGLGNGALATYDATTEASTVVRTWNGWEEWEVYIGQGTVSAGKLTMRIDDDGLETAVWTGMRLKGTMRDNLLFSDGFESGDTTAWIGGEE